MKKKILICFSIFLLGLCSCNESPVVGPQGVQGEQGIQGENGKDGLNGKDGSSLLNGEGIPSSELGKNGDSYVDTLTWDYYTKVEDAWVKSGNIKGTDGTNGADGTSVLNGEGLPSNDLGKDGDTYIDTSNYDFYLKKDNKWIKKGNIKGEPGDEGSTGKSAYDIYKETYPLYPGTEKDWINDLSLGKLAITLSFETNGGNVIEDKTYCKGEEIDINEFETPTKEDYTFTGWYLDSDTTIRCESSFTALNNITLYAGYHQTYITVNYMVNDSLYEEKSYEYGSTLSNILDGPERLAYNFNGWMLNGEYFDTNTPLTENITLVGDYSIDQLELPYLEINTLNKEAITSKDAYVSATISLSGTEDNQYDLSNLSGKVKGRGNSTWGQPKKPYKIKFDKKQSLFGSDYKAKSWVLLANHFDKSLSRNAIAYELASKMTSIAFSPSRNYVDVYLNGTYVGVYLLTDQIETGNGRVEVDETEAEDGNTGYLMELDDPNRIKADGGVLGESYFQSNGSSFAFKTPDIEDEYFVNNSAAIIKYMNSYMDSCFDAMNGTSWETITDLIDVETFAESYLVQEIFANTDCGYSSFYLTKDKDGKLKAGPVWDFDIGAGNCNYNMGNNEECAPDKTLYASNANVFYKLLLNHNEFRELVINKLYAYENVIDEVVSLANTQNSEGYYQKYMNALNRNFEKWQIMGSYLWPEPNDVVKLDTVEQQLDFLYNWLSRRFDYMKQQYPNE